ncbi:MAG: hypothetical protein M1819_005424 [Sarea resinae]|nr:MAG: hypothetical protein M1819_005424 [Sarea resinae]
MLHEILLALSGHPSPLLPPPGKGGLQSSSATFPLLSPPEKAVLASLSRLSDLHRQLQAHTTRISSSHPSTICRAVSTAIASTQLARFQQKILDVESRLLKKDSDLVGGYEIVPLSGIVGEFDEWTRRMEWLWEMARYMLPLVDDGDKQRVQELCSGAAIIDKLRDEAQTGYPDIEEAALNLGKVAETAWLRQLSSWVLYGRLPTFGKDDFFIQVEVNSGKSEFVLRSSLMPRFVTLSTASSILFIGRSLDHIRTRGSTIAVSESRSLTSPELALLPKHLRFLSGLSSPISPSSLSRAIASIRLSLSQNTLQQLLPLPKILEMLSLLRDFFLLGRGEFAIALINEADERIRSRHRRAGAQTSKPSDALAEVVIKEGEVTAVLARTWATLSSYATEEDPVDELLDLARDLIHLSLSKPSDASQTARSRPKGVIDDDDRKLHLSDTPFDDLLLSTPTTLLLSIPSPLDLFLTASDLKVYSSIHAYLLSIRRAHVRLTDLWKHTTLRRDHPSPLGPPHSCTARGQEIVRAKRARANARSQFMRRVWASCSAAVFLLGEMGEYFQGEVVRGSWEVFRTWLEGPSAARPPSSSGSSQSHPSRPATATSTAIPKPRNSLSLEHAGADIWMSASASASASASVPPSNSHPPRRPPHDPETISRAHTIYQHALARHLLLTSPPSHPHSHFTHTLRAFLAQTDALIALISRLETAQLQTDLETDDGVVDAFVDWTREERRVRAELETAVVGVNRGVRAVVGVLRGLGDDGRVGTGMGAGIEKPSASTSGWSGGEVEGGGGGGGEGAVEAASAFLPWRPGGARGGVDHLLMRLDFGSGIDGEDDEHREHDHDHDHES